MCPRGTQILIRVYPGINASAICSDTSWGEGNGSFPFREQWNHKENRLCQSQWWRCVLNQDTSLTQPSKRARLLRLKHGRRPRPPRTSDQHACRARALTAFSYLCGACGPRGPSWPSAIAILMPFSPFSHETGLTWEPVGGDRSSLAAYDFRGSLCSGLFFPLEGRN